MHKVYVENQRKHLLFCMSKIGGICVLILLTFCTLSQGAVFYAYPPRDSIFYWISSSITNCYVLYNINKKDNYTIISPEEIHLTTTINQQEVVMWSITLEQLFNEYPTSVSDKTFVWLKSLYQSSIELSNLNWHHSFQQFLADPKYHYESSNQSKMDLLKQAVHLEDLERRGGKE